jgi:hypothetical protein
LTENEPGSDTVFKAPNTPFPIKSCAIHKSIASKFSEVTPKSVRQDEPVEIKDVKPRLTAITSSDWKQDKEFAQDKKGNLIKCESKAPSKSKVIKNIKDYN